MAQTTNLKKYNEEQMSICNQVNEFHDSYKKIDARINISQLLEFILSSAVSLNASDIHLIVESKNLIIKLRIDGILKTLVAIDGNIGILLTRYIKLQGKIDISATLHPLEGRFSYILSEKNIDIRISIIPTVTGEKINLRILSSESHLLDINRIGFDENEISLIMRKINTVSGFIVLCGPTGSGKSTTLFSILNELNDGTKNIVSIEDPVEFFMDGISQISLSKNDEFGIDNILKFVLRQDPDILVIGETRDKKTADISLKASLTGHLVLTTLHTKSSLGAIKRLMDLEIPSYIIADALSLVISQRLVRTLCPKCKNQIKSTTLSKDLFDIKEETSIYIAIGCKSCMGTGYTGRKAVFELLDINEKNCEIIKKGNLDSLTENLEDIKLKIRNMILRGETSVEEGYRYI